MLLFYPLVFVYINVRVLVLLLGYQLVVLTTVILYVLACDPLPPCTGKVVEWVRGLRGVSALRPHRLPQKLG